mmetsp:Transcript_44536/g.88249  ORF Transcript_44536/g.88249 Transcript_44536/m.88249 type:complete len:727 (+) Transcript_44536:122-2302(+)|eukprot:CAMPEP_0172699404 /NCGR_PEP_ID=MMETSP1074-20121228/30157_1 /TAXON_ID=2916 /ORGANISM="Ceratium fusus, Strain PA161109" /LENGTH=726 /DNA_ID=CAMNT_0013520599 /DNA_START=93 /DNA_END=2273 /DNA_ORIENTATION=+
MSGIGSRTELLNVLGDVKARIQDKLGIVEFPMPQFILIGKQSVGKSRLIEALAGETFNFISGTLGSRRPTVLEFRHTSSESKWYFRDMQTNQWNLHSVAEVMKLVGDAHEELGETVSSDPIYVRLESVQCVDMQIVDLPGFRDFAVDASKQELAGRIVDLVMHFMRNPQNVMICVEQCGDAATMSTLAKCRELDKDFKRTVLVRNKLDKYYDDLTPENVNAWVDGFGDLPDTLTSFAMTLPFWKEGTPAPLNFAELREEKNNEDMRIMQGRGLSAKNLNRIGFKSFVGFMEKKIEQMFADAIQPVLSSLKELKKTTTQKEFALSAEYDETNPLKILSTTRECGTSFAGALTHVMEGVPSLKCGRMTLEEELRKFHEHHNKRGSEHFVMLPCEEFCGLDDYLEYLTQEASIGAHDVQVNGGAQFRRVMAEVEIFLRFSEIAVETKKRDVIQAHGVSMSSLTWRDVIVKLLNHEAHKPLQMRVCYVGERIRWFFEIQKECVLDFMSGLEGAPSSSMYSGSYSKHAKFIKQNEMIKHLVFQTYDNACERQLRAFMDLFENMLTSTFSNPWVFLKSATAGSVEDGGDAMPQAVSEDDQREQIPKEIQSRSGIESTLSTWLQDIPTEAHQIDEAVDKVQMLVLKTYSFIRSQVCDQVELFAYSFFKLPMLRRLGEDMSNLVLSESDESNYEQRRKRLSGEIDGARIALQEVQDCIDRLEDFKVNCEAKRML